MTAETPNPDAIPQLRGSAAVYKQLRRAILEGQYEFNEQLPPERELAQYFGSARGTIRNALDLLEQAHLVKKKMGSGTYVSYDKNFDSFHIADETSPIELIDTRLAIEPHIIRLVVMNAKNNDIRRLEEALKRVQDSSRRLDEFSRADEHFHLTLANCTQNALLIWIYQRINDIRAHDQWSARKKNILTPTKIALYNRHHGDLVSAIKQRDSNRAVKEIRSHLLQAKRDLLGNTHNLFHDL